MFIETRRILPLVEPGKPTRTMYESFPIRGGVPHPTVDMYDIFHRLIALPTSVQERVQSR